MRRHVKSVFAGAACSVLLAAGALPAVASADDQARLDAAIDAFEQRMTDAGWIGEPSEDDEPDDTFEPDDSFDDEFEDDSDTSDDPFNECFGELSGLFEDAENAEFPGQTALRESREFTYAPEGAAPETTEEFSFELDAEETIAAFAISVDESGADLLDSFVDTIGAKETGDCMREAMEEEMASSSSDEELVSELEFAVENEADIGIGDRSARVSFDMSATLMGIAFDLDFNMYLARVDRDLAMVVHGTVGDVETMSGLDPLAELQTIVDSLAG